MGPAPTDTYTFEIQPAWDYEDLLLPLHSPNTKNPPNQRQKRLASRRAPVKRSK